jgi:hypothetical protein
VDDSFVAAAIDAEYHDDRGPLIRYLSERPLGRQEQFALAQILEKPERKTGRPRELETLAAEAVASFFYREWRNRNRRSGISDHGHRGEMKDYAASFAVELACTYPADGAPKEPEEHDVQAVRDMMDRPRHRRLTLDEALLEMVRRGNAKCRQNP